MTTKPQPMTPTQKRRAYLSTPADIANSLVERIRRSHGEGYRLLSFGSKALDYALTMYPGSVTAIVGRPGQGKALALDTSLPTPTGWTTMGEVEVGDQLIGADGRPTTVVAATSVMHNRPCYRLEFSDGEKIVADANHEWLTHSRAERRYGKPATIKTTREIAETLRCDTSDQRVNHSVDIGRRATNGRRYIVAADPVESVPVRCVQVDNDSHMYLAGRMMIPTHNSMICKCLAKTEHARIERDGMSDSECVVYVTLEEPQEKLAVQIGGLKFSWRDVMRGTLASVEEAEMAAIAVAKVLRNLYVIHQAGSVNGKRMPPLTTTQIFDTIEAVQDEYGKRPTLVVLDYLQLIQGDALRSEKQKTEMVMQASNGAVRIARALQVPVVMAVQASRDADDGKPPLPRIKHMQHSSAIEQDADIILGLCRPAAVDSIQDEIAKNGTAKISIGKEKVTVTDSLMIVSPLKARDDGGAGKRYGIHVDPVSLSVHDIDRRYGE